MLLLNRRLSFAVLLVLIILFSSLYFWRNYFNDFILVKTAPIQHGELTASIIATGKVKPSIEITIRAPVDGVIDKILVKEGDIIYKGKPIVRLDSRSGRIIMTSPIPGTVLFKPDTTEIGATVLEGQSLLTIGDLNNLTVKADINESDAKDLKIGQRVIIKSDTYLGQEYSGRIKSIAPQVSEIEGTAKVPIEIDILTNSPFKPGNRVDVDIITADRKDTYYIPLEAVINRSGGKVIYIAKGNKAFEVSIKTGISNINYVEILSTTQLDNEKVIISNDTKIRDGILIKTN